MENGRDEKARDFRTRITVLYEDADVVVIDKPAGLLVHEDGRTEEPTVVDWLLAHAPEARGVGEPGRTPTGGSLERSGVVHRLDAETSGVLILAKTQDAFVHLKEQFHGRRAKKEYHAFVYGAMKEKWGTIRRTIGRSPRDFRLRSAERGARGLLRPAVTNWEVIAQSASHAYLKVMPQTGRTHQIRVHLKAIGKPIVHDPLYGPGPRPGSDDLGFERLALHAHTLTLVTPDGTSRAFTAPLPEDFVRAAAAVAERSSSC
jgi:23S rRNA pseudouridine1911/1915/1917 synthase